MNAPTPAGPHAESDYWSRFREDEWLLGGTYVPVSDALKKVAELADYGVYDAVSRGWVADPTSYPGFDPIGTLLYAALGWTAANRFGPSPRGGPRLPGNPTDAVGRALLREKLWLPAVNRMEMLSAAIGLDELRARAGRAIIALAENRIPQQTVLLPYALVKFLAEGQEPRRPRHRPRITTAERSAQYARAARLADTRPGHEPGAWFNLSVLSRFGLSNPRSGWTPEVRLALERLGIRTHRARTGRRPWKLCVTRRESH